MNQFRDLLSIYNLHIYRAGSIALLTSDNSRTDYLRINVVNTNRMSTSMALMSVFPPGPKRIMCHGPVLCSKVQLAVESQGQKLNRAPNSTRRAASAVKGCPKAPDERTVFTAVTFVWLSRLALRALNVSVLVFFAFFVRLKNTAGVQIEMYLPRHRAKVSWHISIDRISSSATQTECCIPPNPELKQAMDGR